MSKGPAVQGHRPWWTWAALAILALVVIAYFVLDALAGTHGV
jgi:hypothetical protein